MSDTAPTPFATLFHLLIADSRTLWLMTEEVAAMTDAPELTGRAHELALQLELHLWKLTVETTAGDGEMRN